MLIVAGHLEIASDERDSYVASCAEIVAAARQSKGCLDFSVTADPIDPNRVNVYERWESEEAVEVFRGEGPSDDQLPAILAGRVSQYVVEGERKLFDAA